MVQKTHTGTTSDKKPRQHKPAEVQREAYDLQSFCAAMEWSESLFRKVKRAGKIATFKVGDKVFVGRPEMERIIREGISFCPSKNDAPAADVAAGDAHD
jgi:hypothetical protein